jgi:hypothetical protein
MRKTEKEKMIVLKKTLREEAHKERLLEAKLRQEAKEKIDSILEKEHFDVKKKLCSAVRCYHTKNCPFYCDPEDYERKLIKDKLPKTRCTYWSEHPNILEKLDYIVTGRTLNRIAKKTPIKKTANAKILIKKDLQKQLVSVDKTLKEISERWSIQI